MRSEQFNSPQAYRTEFPSISKPLSSHHKNYLKRRSSFMQNLEENYLITEKKRRKGIGKGI